MRYEQHIARAARYAALALTDRDAHPDELDHLSALHDDVAVSLAEALRRVTLIAPTQPRAVQTFALARHPVRTLVDRLSALPRLGPAPDHRDAPTGRWAGRPAGPAAALDPVAVWKGLAIDAFLAGAELEMIEPELTEAARWSAVGDLATLAHMLAVSSSDLLNSINRPSRERRRLDHVDRLARGAFAALGVEAREVIHLAGAPLPADVKDADYLGPDRVLTVPRLAALPAATQNLTRLLVTQTASATDLLGVTRVLSQVSAAAATALNTAAHAPGAALPAMLTATSGALHDHAVALARVVVGHQTRLGALEHGSALLLGQAREIGAIALPRLRDLAPRPTQAEATSPDLLEYAAAVSETTRAIRHEFAALHDRRDILIRDRTEDAAHGWRPTQPRDLAALLTGLDRAASAAGRAPRPPQTRPAPAPKIANVAQILDLQAALARRQVQLRPTQPTGLVLKGNFPINRGHLIER